MIDRGDIRQAIDRCSNIWASLPGAGYGQFEHKADSLIAKFKEAGGTVQRDWCMSRVTAIISLWLSASSSANHGLLIITIDNAITYKSPARQKCQRTEAGERGNCMQMRKRDGACSMHHEGIVMLNWKWCSAWWCCQLVDAVGCTSKRSVSQCVKPPPPPAWIMQPPPDWQTPLNGIISPSERGWSLCKNNWKEPRSILMSSADRVAHIDGQLMQLLWAIHALPAGSKCLSNKQTIWRRCLLGFCFYFNIFCAACLAASTVFLLPNSRNEEMMVMVSFGLFLRFVFEQ